ncbi:MAG: two-component sensor histidine kinase [Bacillus thermozeamaize]|uniref:histidine kinase n=1 Tax=Bacillus thermozeamaize TaxID=230954 RepID=A0A1Y3PWP2_9BACI|nr:MAG: two-component sensor histidine kinase [Bacillus thermozeamaize]
MKNIRKRLRFLAALLIFIFALGACWTAAFFLTSLLYSRIGARPPELVRFLMDATLGLLIFAGGLAALSRVAFPGHMAGFQALTDAMRRLSRGDFNVKLQVQAEEDGQFGRLVQSFNEMASGLKALEDMRQEFISNVSHEIQSPLASISGFARALRSDRLSEEERGRYLDIIETESKRLSRLSDNLLKLAALESEHPPFRPERYRLDRQLREAVLACEPQWLEKSIDMEVDLEETEIVADPELMGQVWGNLIHNAVKFTPAGGTIGVLLRRSGEAAEVCVSDTGIGIGEEDLPRIFERFYKADKARGRAGGGSGLGLSIVKKIVDLHRGSIEVRSKPGEGTTFTVRLPLEHERKKEADNKEGIMDAF